MTLWFLAGGLAAFFCIVVGIRDVRRRDYIWAVAAFMAAGVIILTPNPNHAVSVVLPLAN